MTVCQTATNEFLRQFWLAIYPPPSDLQTASAATPAQKAAKAAKMIGYLERTQEKVGAIMHGAQKAGVDPGKIHTVSCMVLSPSGPRLDFWLGHETCPRRRGEGHDVLEDQEYHRHGPPLTARLRRHRIYMHKRCILSIIHV